ncbi:lytic transglycosylase domain-containing protein [Bosea sp. 117]|uniref:lytic transglycosylase domain-containing protein n=1 Tax=Bosea sp. 117 TaxID=1125973 RepID=UPI0020BEB94F|nr:lytic transglycosylase domain-containing protein [Bosea sp. 117]
MRRACRAALVPLLAMSAGAAVPGMAVAGEQQAQAGLQAPAGLISPVQPLFYGPQPPAQFAPGAIPAELLTPQPEAAPRPAEHAAASNGASPVTPARQPAVPQPVAADSFVIWVQPPVAPELRGRTTEPAPQPAAAAAKAADAPKTAARAAIPLPPRRPAPAPAPAEVAAATPAAAPAPALARVIPVPPQRPVRLAMASTGIAVEPNEEAPEAAPEEPPAKPITEAPLRGRYVLSREKGPPHIEALIAQHSERFDVPAQLIRRVVWRESKYDPRARNGPYWGLMQIRVETARGLGFRGQPADLLDADTNMTYAVAYLANAYRVAGRNETRAVQLYAKGYYYEAKRKGMLGALVKTASVAD